MRQLKRMRIKKKEIENAHYMNSICMGATNLKVIKMFSQIKP